MIAILTYHALDDRGDVLATPPRLFTAQMQLLRDRGVTVIPLAEIPGRQKRGATDPAVAITFDDGFTSVYEHGLPVLAKLGFPATVFLVTAYSGHRNAWPGQPSGVEPRPLLSWREVRALSEAGVAAGSHTRTHPDLRRLSDAHLDEELAGSKRAIEDAVGRPVDALAYPYGASDVRVRERARAHFRLACSTTLDFVQPESDLFALERLDAYYLRRPVLMRRLFTPDTVAYLRVRRGLRALRAPLSARKR